MAKRVMEILQYEIKLPTWQVGLWVILSLLDWQLTEIALRLDRFEEVNPIMVALGSLGWKVVFLKLTMMFFVVVFASLLSQTKPGQTMKLSKWIMLFCSFPLLWVVISNFINLLS